MWSLEDRLLAYLSIHSIHELGSITLCQAVASARTRGVKPQSWCAHWAERRQASLTDASLTLRASVLVGQCSGPSLTRTRGNIARNSCCLAEFWGRWGWWVGTPGRTVVRKRMAGLSLENRVRPGGDKGAGPEGAAEGLWAGKQFCIWGRSFWRLDQTGRRPSRSVEIQRNTMWAGNRPIGSKVCCGKAALSMYSTGFPWK